MPKGRDDREGAIGFLRPHDPGTSKGSHDIVELLLNALADAIADRLEHRQETRRRLLSAEQVAEYINRSKSAIYNLVSEGKLRAVRLDRRLSFNIRDLDNLIDQAKK
jgi:excisionase family DNA binding protein